MHDLGGKGRLWSREGRILRMIEPPFTSVADIRMDGMRLVQFSVVTCDIRMWIAKTVE